MRKRFFAFVALVAGVLLALMLAVPAGAHETGPCGGTPTDPGHSEFARHHIVPKAQAGTLGAGGHKPGSHRGFSACNPSGR